LIDYEDLIPDSATVQVTDRDVLNMMKSQDSLYFEPGSEYRYSNSGYAVLAMIIEKISGITFSYYLKNNIFEPLGMSGTVAFKANENDVINRSYGYAATDTGFTFKDQSLTSAVLGDGGIYSNVFDLLRWDRALYTDKLISAELLKKAFVPDTLHNGESTGYGFGWRIDQYKDLERIHHTGSTCGFRNASIRFPGIRLSVIILTNRDKPDVLNLAENIANLYLEN
jgi:CubicO group peptidase (beta-lactamase class C family)